MHVLTVCLIAVDLIVRHGKVRISNPYICAFYFTGALIVTGTFCKVNGRNLCGTYVYTFVFRKCKYSPDRRLHLIALLCHLLLQIMQIIYAHRPECRSLIKTENQDTSAVLIGKAG